MHFNFNPLLLLKSFLSESQSSSKSKDLRLMVAVSKIKYVCVLLMAQPSSLKSYFRDYFLHTSTSQPQKLSQNPYRAMDGLHLLTAACYPFLPKNMYGTRIPKAAGVMPLLAYILIKMTHQSIWQPCSLPAQVNQTIHSTATLLYYNSPVSS